MSASVEQGLRLLKLLWSETDVAHKLSQKEIQTLYKARYGEDIGTKSLRAVLRQLASDPDTGVQFEKGRTRQNAADSVKKTTTETIMSGLHVEHDFTEPELRVLIDLVMYCDGMSAKYRKDIVSKLEKLSSRFFRTRSIMLPDKGGKEHFSSILLSVELLDEAMHRNRKVSLHYMKYDTKGQLVKRRTDGGAVRRYILSPYQFAVNNGRYYLICADDVHSDGLAHYRVDRICNVKILEDQPRRPLAEILPGTTDLSAQMQQYCDEHVNMYSGTPVSAVFRLEPHAVPILADLFGQAVWFEEWEGELHAHVRGAPMAIEMAAKAYVPDVQLLSPAELRVKVEDDMRAALQASQTLPNRVEADAELHGENQCEASEISETAPLTPPGEQEGQLSEDAFQEQ